MDRLPVQRRWPQALPFLAVQAVVATVTLQDIARRPDHLVRGSKTVWRVVSTLSTGGAVAYWLVGRAPEH